MLAFFSCAEDDMEIDKETKARLLLDFHNSISIDGFSLSCELPVRWPVTSG